MKKIYFAHDQQESAAARQNFLEMAGYEVQMMKSSREVFLALEQEQPALLLMDILIEGHNGFETAAEIHARLPRRTFPMILCARIYRTRQFRDAALRSGASEFLLQPMQLDDFLHRVNQVLEEWTPPGEEELDVKVA